MPDAGQTRNGAGLQRFLSLDDFEPAARRKLPRPLFAYVAGGVETNASLRANLEAFSRYGFVTRVLRDISVRSTETALFGRTYAAPFGIAPMGISALTAYDGDLALARAAAGAGVPMVMSGASLTPLEEVARENPDIWFQAYLPGDERGILLMLDRVEAARIDTLVVTVDTQARANRENNIRAGFSSPLRPSLRLAFDGLTRPAWLLDTFFPTLAKRGLPHFENSSHERGAPVISARAMREFGGRSRFGWGHIRAIRRRWRGRLVIKGILSPEDAVLAAEHGVDGVILSNHGGRQLDGAVSPLLILEEVLAVVPGLPVMIDGGFRRGADVVKALALGAAFVWVGRPFSYAATVAGAPGVGRAIDLLRLEVDRDIAMLGYTAVHEVGRDCLRNADGSRLAERPAPARGDLRVGHGALRYATTHDRNNDVRS